MLRTALTTVLLLALAWPATAQTSALGRSGELYTLHLGQASELFEQPSSSTESTVMALDVVRQNGKTQRLLVPGTEDEDFEMSASMIYEPDSSSVFIIWASQYHFAHSRIRLVQYSDGAWSEPIDITDDPFTFKTAPTVAVTRESFTIDADGGLVSHERTILHTLWFEEEWSGDAVLYSPLILVNGELVSGEAVLRLAELSGSREQASASAQRELMISPAASSGRSDHAVVVALVDPAANQLLNFEIEALPLEVTQLADDVRDIVRPRTACDQGGLKALASDARANIVTIARKRGFRGAMASGMAIEAHAALMDLDESAACASTNADLSDEIAETVIDAGVELSGGLFAEASDARANIVTIARKLDLDHRLVVREMSSRTAPQVDGPTRVLVSRDGLSNLVAWEKNGMVRYVESDDSDDGWSATMSLRIQSGLDDLETQRLLQGRLDG